MCLTGKQTKLQSPTRNLSISRSYKYKSMALIFRHLLSSGEGKWEKVFSSTNSDTIHNIHNAQISCHLFAPVCLHLLIKHGHFLSWGPNINVKKIYSGQHTTWIWNSQKYLFQYSSQKLGVKTSTTAAQSLLLPSHSPRDGMPFIKLLYKCVHNQF